MRESKWDELKEEIGRKFKVESSGVEDLMKVTEDGSIYKIGLVEALIFQTPAGKIKLARESIPVDPDKHPYMNKEEKVGSTEYNFSKVQYMHKLKAYNWSDEDDDWKEIDASRFSD